MRAGCEEWPHLGDCNLVASTMQLDEASRSYDQLCAELDNWSALGLSCRFWVRDDDAISDTPKLRRLLNIVRDHQACVAIAVIPKRSDESLVKVLLSNGCCIWQHGWAHDFHKCGEFGEERALEL